CWASQMRVSREGDGGRQQVWRSLSCTKQKGCLPIMCAEHTHTNTHTHTQTHTHTHTQTHTHTHTHKENERQKERRTKKERIPVILTLTLPGVFEIGRAHVCTPVTLAS